MPCHVLPSRFDGLPKVIHLPASRRSINDKIRFLHFVKTRRYPFFLSLSLSLFAAKILISVLLGKRTRLFLFFPRTYRWFVLGAGINASYFISCRVYLLRFAKEFVSATVFFWITFNAKTVEVNVESRKSLEGDCSIAIAAPSDGPSTWRGVVVNDAGANPNRILPTSSFSLPSFSSLLPFLLSSDFCLLCSHLVLSSKELQTVAEHILKYWVTNILLPRSI